MNPSELVIREIYAAINRNEIAAALKYFHPEIQRIEFEGLPMEGSYYGLEEMGKHFIQARGTWEEGACGPEKFIFSGNKVVVYVHVRVKLKKNQEWVEGRIGDGFVFCDGKVIEMRSFLEREQALKWAGIENES